ncbi:MAG: YggS family pyridoxal phosphate-dependent enzyme [bacterium]
MTIADRVRALEADIAAACGRSGRARTEVRLVAVSKTRTVEEVIAAARAGITEFGENRVQEAAGKIPGVNAGQPGVRWHLVGHLQTNKVKRALELFELIHSVDSVRLAEELQARAAAAGSTVEVLVEVNTSGEESKFGVQPADLTDVVTRVARFDRLCLSGLMTIGPGWSITDPEASRPCFALLRRLRGEAEQRLGRSLPHLSMGMSSDYAVGIEEGATMVRVGTAIFGARG